MRRTRRSLALPAALGLLAALPITAQAQPELQLDMPATAQGNTRIGVSLKGCTTPTTATSPGFKAPAELTMDPAYKYLTAITFVVSTPGNYVATASCDGKTVTASFTVTPAVPKAATFLSPTVVEPGGKINGTAGKSGAVHSCVGGVVTSPGFAEPLVMNMSMPGVYSGSTTVIMTPGTYTATKQCEGGTIETQNFTISGGTPTTPPPAPGTPKPPIVKPRGAADTGGGGTA